MFLGKLNDTPIASADRQACLSSLIQLFWSFLSVSFLFLVLNQHTLNHGFKISCTQIKHLSTLNLPEQNPNKSNFLIDDQRQLTLCLVLK